MIRTLLTALLLVIFASPVIADDFELIRGKDGDSFVVEIRGVRTDIRLIGIDCPEYRQEWGKDAKKFTERWLRTGPAQVEYDVAKFDRYNRILGYVWRDGKMLNYELVRQGYCIPAYYKPNGQHRVEFEQALDLARQEKRGFWAQGGLKMTPAEFRRK